jgi:Zn-dependent alcohol dehydrogenase
MSGKLLLDELISHRYQLDQVNEAHQALVDGGTLRGLLVYE